MNYIPSGICARLIEYEVEDGKLKNVFFTGSCSGNSQAISALVEGMEIKEVIKHFQNIKCGYKNTSCPAELAKALIKYLGG